MASSVKTPSYARRLFLYLLGYSVLLVGGMLIFQYNRERQFKVEELNIRLQTINAEILNDIEEGGNPSEIRNSVGDVHRLRVSIIDSTGRVISDNTLDRLPEGNHLNREEIAKAMKTGSGYAIRRHSESTGETYFYSATKGKTGVIVRTAAPYSVSLTEFLQADYGFMWFTFSLASCLCILGFFATRRLGQNVSRLNLFAQKAERGERISDIEPFPHDELGEISHNIVRLYARLQQTASERDRQHRAALYEQKEKERIKKQLTNNINHELKTPVASIRICIETLLCHEGMPQEKRRDFLERCMADTDRLARLLEDVSILTRMDDGAASISKTGIDLAATIREAADEQRPVADAKRIAIYCSVGEGITIEGNPALLESIFRNLIANAISYSGGTEITIRETQSMPGQVTLEVADNGCGIPEEHLPRIFERFYRIDKGRSRAAGGTGLGLAIVKNAVVFHGGSISARNQQDGGIAFRITLPTRQHTA